MVVAGGEDGWLGRLGGRKRLRGWRFGSASAMKALICRRSVLPDKMEGLEQSGLVEEEGEGNREGTQANGRGEAGKSACFLQTGVVIT